MSSATRRGYANALQRRRARSLACSSRDVPRETSSPPGVDALRSGHRRETLGGALSRAATRRTGAARRALSQRGSTFRRTAARPPAGLERAHAGVEGCDRGGGSIGKRTTPVRRPLVRAPNGTMRRRAALQLGARRTRRGQATCRGADTVLNATRGHPLLQKVGVDYSTRAIGPQRDEHARQNGDRRRLEAMEAKALLSDSSSSLRARRTFVRQSPGKSSSPAHLLRSTEAEPGGCWARVAARRGAALVDTTAEAGRPETTVGTPDRTRASAISRARAARIRRYYHPHRRKVEWRSRSVMRGNGVVHMRRKFTPE